jgi:polysaccharide biosynthesis protein PslH
MAQRRKESGKLRVLMVIPFDNIYPPMNGGMLRCFNLLNQLAKNFEVTALIKQDKKSFLKSAEHFPAIKNCSLLSTADNKKDVGLFSFLPKRYRDMVQFRIWNRSLRESAGSDYLLLYPQLKEFLKENSTDIVIIEDVSILNLAKIVRRYQSKAEIIYDAYNVNTILAKVALAKGEITDKEFNSIQTSEINIKKYTTRIFACSQADLEKITQMNDGLVHGKVVPNGVNIPEWHSVDNGKDRNSHHILFCGSLDYFPNQEGLKWFCTDVFPLILEKVPDTKLIVVGRGDPGEELKRLLRHDSIINHGKVEKVDTYYRNSGLAIVPLLSGSGTRLKLVEAMAFDTAVVSTSIGAEGINYTDGQNILIGDTREDFSVQVIKLITNRVIAEKIASNALQFVKKEYDWNIIGQSMTEYLRGMVA